MCFEVQQNLSNWNPFYSELTYGNPPNLQKLQI
jgi:hypothetical protein